MPGRHRNLLLTFQSTANFASRNASLSARGRFFLFAASTRDKFSSAAPRRPWQNLPMLRRLLLALLIATAAVAQSSPGSFLDVGGTKLWYESCGTSSSDKPGLVLLHDGLVNSITWDAVWPGLCAKFHVVRFDRRGYGRSDAPKTRFSPEADILAVMDQVKMQKAIVVGNSSGGGLALDFALAHPGRVAGLVLIGTVVHGMPSSEYFNERGAKNMAPMQKGDLKAAAENWSRDRYLISGDDAAARKQLRDDLLRFPDNLKYSGTFEIHPDPPTVRRLGEIHVPTLDLVGDADIADVFAYAGAVEAELPLATFEVWKDTGHLVQIQRPQQLLDRMDRFYALAARREFNLPAEKLALFTGPYTCFDLPSKIEIEDQHLVFSITGGPSYRLFASTPDTFFLRTEEATVAFAKNAEGKPTEMVVHNSDGTSFRCPAGSK